jgi:hypothetical protein
MLVDCATFSTLSFFIKGVIRERGGTRDGNKEKAQEREREIERERKRKRGREKEKSGLLGVTSAGHGGPNGSITLSIMPTTFQNQGHLRLIPHALTVSDVCLMR